MTVGSDRATRKRVGVLLPTTGGIARVVALKARPRLPASYLALKGDFRPLKISADYHRFVSGPLAAVLGDEAAGGPFELSLTGDIDTGRSWELPALITHLLAARGLLVECPDENDTAGDDGSGQPATVIWATGKVDPDLGPQADDYAIRQKCRLSRPLLAALGKRGHPIVIVVPAGLGAADMRELDALGETVQARVHTAASLPEVCAALGIELAAGEADVATASQAVATAEPSGTDIAPVRPGKWRRHMLAGGLLGLFGLGAIAILASYWSDPSNENGERNGGTGGVNSMPQVQISRLHAESRNACISRIMTSTPLDSAPIAAHEGRFAVPASEGLCGLRVRNGASEQLSIGLSGELQQFSIQGDNALFRGADIAANDSVDLVFSRPPADIAATLTVRDGNGKQWQVAIELSPLKTEGGQ
ncbi:MAG: hypothetical protein GC150_02750 [Rhizobiales bacterium]|nr:hypothetical protein [Hyphomicrobiales bacterium]